jgi:hypothetical protein
LNELAQREEAQHHFNEIVTAALETFEPGDECLPTGQPNEVVLANGPSSFNLWNLD